MDNPNDDNGYIVEMRVFGFDSKEAARLYSKALVSAFCAMPESAPYASTTGVVTAKEHLAEMNVEALQARVVEARNAALEEAARVADRIMDDYAKMTYSPHHDRMQNAAKTYCAGEIAAAIRDMKGERG